MKYIFILLTLSFLSFSSCNSSSQESCANNEHTTTVVCNIEGMTCGGCEQTVKAKLSQIEGLEVESISHTDGKAICKFSTEKVDEAKIKEILGEDYTLVSIETKEDSK